MKGILLLNLGTPNDLRMPSIRAYLREFLLDPRVIDLPAPLRYLLVYGIILPFRAPKTRHAYQQIWQAQGSPLRYYSQSLADALGQVLGQDYQVVLAMRYGEPSVKAALHQLSHCEHLTVLPLFPQYSSAATGSAIEQVLSVLAKQRRIPSLRVVHQFYDAPAYIDSLADIVRPFLQAPDTFLLCSYHGLPQRQAHEYPAQCYETTRLLTQALSVHDDRYAISFQSRLGRIPWIQPYTEDMLVTLYQRGIKNLVLACPGFTVDCLETLEEIGMRAKEEWLALGGESFTMVPCLNDDPRWVTRLAAYLA